MVKTSHIGVILIVTSRACIRVRNHTPVLIVVNIFQRDGSLAYTFGLYTMARSPTSVRSVVKTSHIGVILTITSGVCTRVRNHTTALTVVKTFHGNLI